jgi:hypothetical protein
MRSGWDLPIGDKNPPLEVVMLEKFIAWTMVAIYYTIGCGVIVLSLRGAL